MSVDPTKLPYRPCVGQMVINRQGLVWIGRRPNERSSPEGPGSWWQMPQGGIDDGEEPGPAALRELFEETGMRSVRIIGEHPEWLYYDLPPSLVGKAWGGRYRGQKQKWFLIRLEGSEDEINLTPEPGHEAEFDAWTWVSVTELPGLIVPFKRAVYEQVVGYFAPRIGPA